MCGDIRALRSLRRFGGSFSGKDLLNPIAEVGGQRNASAETGRGQQAGAARLRVHARACQQSMRARLWITRPDQINRRSNTCRLSTSVRMRLGQPVPAANRSVTHPETRHHRTGLGRVESRRRADEHSHGFLHERRRHAVQPRLERCVQRREVGDAAPHVESQEIVDLMVGNSSRRMEEIHGKPVGEEGEQRPSFSVYSVPTSSSGQRAMEASSSHCRSISERPEAPLAKYDRSGLAAKMAGPMEVCPVTPMNSRQSRAVSTGSAVTSQSFTQAQGPCEIGIVYDGQRSIANEPQAVNPSPTAP